MTVGLVRRLGDYTSPAHTRVNATQMISNSPA